MQNKPTTNEDRNTFIRGMVIGALCGGALGIAAGLLYTTGLMYITGLDVLFAASPANPVITGTGLGILIGGGIGSLISLYSSPDKIPGYVSGESDVQTTEQIVNDIDQTAKLQLKEEQLDISKRLVQTGEVNIHREIITEEKNVTVPVKREELVIEKKILDENNDHATDNKTETIRIPICEERVNIVKEPVTLESVSIHKHQYQENKHIEETLKKEKLHVNTTGNPKIQNKARRKH